MSWFKQIFNASEKETQNAGVETTGSDPASPVAGGTAEILGLLKQYLSAQMSAGAPVAASSIPDEAHVLDGGYVDSVTAVDFLMYVQKQFGVRLSETDLAGGLGQLSKLAQRLAERESL